MQSPQYGELAIGTFVQAQPELTRFLSAHAEDLGGAEAVMHAVFHAQVSDRVLSKGPRRKTCPIVPFSLLDATHSDDPMNAR